MELPPLWHSVLLATLVVIAQQTAQQLQIDSGTPAVSPDGTSIAFTSNRDGAPSIFIISLDGTGERELTRNPPPQGNAASTQSWLLYGT